MLELAKLISKNYTVNDLQERIAVETEYEVWIDTKSISRAEFSAAGSNGLTPEMVVRTNAINYSGEDEIESIKSAMGYTGRTGLKTAMILNSICSGKQAMRYSNGKQQDWPCGQSTDGNQRDTEERAERDAGCC